ncbi:MAG TPA: beta-propeller domain-containing protein [Polyangiales bacterium]
MHVLRISLGIALGLSITACDPLAEREDGRDTGWPEAGDDAEGSGPDGGKLQIDGKPQVGDTIAGGRVTEVNVIGGSGSSAQCTHVVIEQAPAWQCSSEQIQAARNGGSFGGAVGGGAFGGAGPGGYTPEPPGAVLKSQLQQATCKTLADLRREPLKQQMRTQVDSQRRALLQRCLPVTRTVYFDSDGKETTNCRFGGGWADAGVAASGSPGGGGTPGGAAGGTAGGGGASEYSTTNLQVDGVDEADFVKNDAQYVYALSPTGLHVIDAWPAEATHEIRYLPLAGLPTRLFLAGDKLVVYVRTGAGGSSGGPSGAQACTYGYDCRFGAEPGQTLIKVFDVKDPAQPKELGQYEMSGSYLASRRVGNFVYTVVFDRPVGAAPSVNTTLQVDRPEQLTERYDTIVADIGNSVDQLDDSYFLPWVEQRAADGKVVNKLSSCDQALVSDSASGRSLTSLVSFDLSQLGAPTRTVVASNAGFIYASAAALYMATDGIGGQDNVSRYYGQSANERSTIHKFALEGVNTRYAGSVAIRGHVLNQFSMDEQADVLRVATSSGQVPSPDVSSNITQVAVTDGKLNVVGELTGLAPQEDIRSVRFDGDRGFMVTFKKTDPLFVIDLSVVGAPKVLGELKIPGYSTYMHPLDKEHLLAIGLDAEDQGSFAFFTGIQLQIFDVSKLSEPKLLHKTTIGTRGSTSDALTNHLAFNYFAAKGLLALPLTVCEGSAGGGSFGSKLTFSGLMVFDVSLQSGIKERGRMPFVSAEESARVADCNSWWTQGGSAVKRSIFLDDYAAGISDTFYKVAPLSKLNAPVASVSLLP